MIPNHEEAFKHSWTLRYMLTGSNRDTLINTLKVLLGLFFLILLLNWYDHCLFLYGLDRDGNSLYGFLQDLPDYLYFLVFILTPLMYKNILRRFLETFYGRGTDEGENQSAVKSVLPAIRFDGAFRKEYRRYARYVVEKNHSRRRQIPPLVLGGACPDPFGDYWLQWNSTYDECREWKLEFLVACRPLWISFKSSEGAVQARSASATDLVWCYYGHGGYDANLSQDC